MKALRAFSVWVVLTSPFLSVAADFELTILHTNDLHAHEEPTKVKGKWYGGYARLATAIKREEGMARHHILLNAGDTFQGTLFFNVYEGLSDLAFMNEVGFQGAAVGNHEFDRGARALGTFASLANFPLLAANLDVDAEASLAHVIKRSAVVEVDGEKFGLVGAITPDVSAISSVPDTVKMLDLQQSVQLEVDQLHRQGITKVIVLSHCGYALEQKLARAWHGVDVIVGGHSHTLLGDFTLPGLVGQGSYPTVVKDACGHTTLVVQAWEWGKVLGKLVVRFDDKGFVKSWKGAPVPITEDIPEDPKIRALVAAFQMPLASLKNQLVGTVGSDLTREWSPTLGDSTMGDVIADAMLQSSRKYGSTAAFVNAGGVRSGLDRGKVTYGRLIEVQPFGNTLVVLDLTGRELRDAIEEGIDSGGFLIPSAGTQYTFDLSRPVGQRLGHVMIAGQKVVDTQQYKICLNSYTASGGDAHLALKNSQGERVDTGLVDIDCLVAYFKQAGTVLAPKEPRITQTGLPGGGQR